MDYQKKAEHLDFMMSRSQSCFWLADRATSSTRKKKMHDKGCKLRDSALAQAKQLSSQVGRVRKKQKRLKKTTKVVTLTNINGQNWDILVKK